MERKTLTITEVGQIKSGDRKDGKGQWQSLPFKAKDGDKEFSYSTLRTSLFDAIKEGATIEADIEVKQDGDWINRRITQIYQAGQPIGGQKQFRGKSPEELELSAKSYALSYAKDLCVAERITFSELLIQAELFYQWLTKQTGVELKAAVKDTTTAVEDTAKIDLKSLKFKNAGEFYQACLDHLKLSKTRVDAEIPEYDVSKADQREKAWQQILAICKAA